MCYVCCGSVTMMSGSSREYNSDNRQQGRGNIVESLHSCRPNTMETSEWHMAGRGAGQCCSQTSPSSFLHTVKSLDDWRQGLKVTGGPWAVYTAHEKTVQEKNLAELREKSEMKRTKTSVFSLRGPETAETLNWSMSACFFNSKIIIGCNNET